MILTPQLSELPATQPSPLIVALLEVHVCNTACGPPILFWLSWDMS